MKTLFQEELDRIPNDPHKLRDFAQQILESLDGVVQAQRGGVEAFTGLERQYQHEATQRSLLIAAVRMLVMQAFPSVDWNRLVDPE